MGLIALLVEKSISIECVLLAKSVLKLWRVVIEPVTPRSGVPSNIVMVFENISVLSRFVMTVASVMTWLLPVLITLFFNSLFLLSVLLEIVELSSLWILERHILTFGIFDCLEDLRPGIFNVSIEEHFAKPAVAILCETFRYLHTLCRDLPNLEGYRRRPDLRLRWS